jgi:hypothetical protein
MIYGKAPREYATLGGPAPSEIYHGHQDGWTVGAGVDFAFTNNVFASLEHRYMVCVLILRLNSSCSLDFRDEIMAQIYDKGDPRPKRMLKFN